MEFLNWAWRSPAGGEEAVPPAGAGLPDFMRRILLSRGCRTQEEITAFLECQYSLHDPMLLTDMAPAVERIRRALADGERILVFGDYDCDGVTSTVMVYDYLENCGADVLYYIPEREGEGYGLNKTAMDRVKAAGVALVVTVDNGISALAEADYARELGIDLIITDHHQPKDTLPSALAVIDPHRPDCAYPYKDLCGAGVAFKLLCALEDGDWEMLLEQYGDVLAVGILADVVPLTGENRLLVRKGLHTLSHTENPGLLALAEAAGINLEEENADAVTFGLAPRINVAGRMGSVDSAVELLLCTDEERAQELAKELCALNARRKETEADILAEIDGMTAATPALLRQRVIILEGEGWHCGVIGIIASRVVDRWRKPCIILSRSGEEVRGSARSVEGFSMIGAISACAPLLEKYGGHPMAAGFSMKPGREDEFCRQVQAYAMERHPMMPVHSLTVDAVACLAEATLENIQRMNAIAPFGCCNPQPVLVLRDVTLESITPIGGGKHLRLGLSQGGKQAQAVFFGMTEKSLPFQKGERIDCAVTFSINIYNDIPRPSIRIAGIQPSGADLAANLRWSAVYDALQREETPPEDAPAPEFSREDLSVVYRYLRSHTPCALGTDGLWHCLGGAVNYFKVLASIDVLEELGLLEESRENGARVFSVVPSEKKMDLDDSPTYRRIMNLKLVC